MWWDKTKIDNLGNSVQNLPRRPEKERRLKKRRQMICVLAVLFYYLVYIDLLEPSLIVIPCTTVQLDCSVVDWERERETKRKWGYSADQSLLWRYTKSSAHLLGQVFRSTCRSIGDVFIFNSRADHERSLTHSQGEKKEKEKEKANTAVGA